jgi:hypothetical protein
VSKGVRVAPPVMMRASAHGALVVGVVFTSLAAAALSATLAMVGGSVLSRAVAQRISTLQPADTSVAVSGPMSGLNLAQADAALRGLLRTTFGDRGYAVDRAEISRPLVLPPGYGPSRTAQIAPMAADGVESRTTLVAGSWPAPPNPGQPSRGQPVDVALPADIARTLGLQVGSTFTASDSFSAVPVAVRVSGLFRENDPASPYWRLSPVGAAGTRISGDATEYGPALVDPAAFAGGANTVDPGSVLSPDTASWVVRPDLSGIGGPGIRALANAVTRLQGSLAQSSALLTLSASTNLPQALTATAGDVWAARSALAVAAVLSALLALAALLLAVRLLRSRREIESATLRARGGTGWQLVAINAGEALACGVVAVLGGAYGGAALGDALASSPTSAGSRIGAPDLGTWLAAAAAALVSTLIMAGAAAGVSSPVEAWVRRSRQSTVLALARVGGDVAVVALAGVALWQLHQLTLASTSSDGINPVLVAAPALTLAGATLLLIRLVPLAARLGERWARRRHGLLGPLVTWEVSRRPARFTGALLLSVLAVTTGAFALSMHASWHRSQLDQAAFDTGSDVRVEMETVRPADAAAIADSPGVTTAMPLATSPLSTGTVVALDSATASAITLRSDLSKEPLATLWKGIAPKKRQPGLVIPGKPVRIAVTASLQLTKPAPPAEPGQPAQPPAPLPVPPSGPLPADVVFTLLDADNVAYQITSPDILPADGLPHAISGLVSPAARALYPMRLVDISLTGAFTHAQPSVLGVSAADSATGPLVQFTSGSSLGSWRQSATTEQGQNTLAVPCVVRAGSAACTWPSTVTLGQIALDATPPLTGTIMPGIATKSFLQAQGATVGDVVPTTVNGVVVTVRIVGQMAAFPGMGDQPVVVVDLGTLQSTLLASVSAPVTVTAWLLRTDDGAVPPGLPAAATVTSQSGTAATLLTDPLALPPQRMWTLLAVAAGLLAVLGGSVNVAAEIRSRRRDAALLAALGVSRWQQLRGLCLERLLLGIAASGFGLILGTTLSTLLIAPLTPSASGTVPIPPVLVSYVWSWSAVLAAVVALGPVAAIATGTLRRPDAAAELRLAEAI